MIKESGSETLASLVLEMHKAFDTVVGLLNGVKDTSIGLGGKTAIQHSGLTMSVFLRKLKSQNKP